MDLRDVTGTLTSAVGLLVVAATVLPPVAQLLPEKVLRLLPRSLQFSQGLPGADLMIDLKHQDEVWQRMIPGKPGAPDLGKVEAEYKNFIQKFPSMPPPPMQPSGGKKPVKAQPSPPPPKLYDGRILFEPERTMQIRHAEVVMVRMDAGASPDLEAGIDPQHYKVDTVKVGRRMRVHLDGDPPDAFEIIPMLPPDEQQAVTNLSASTWMWNVTPKKNGAAALLLHIWALAKVEDSDTLVPLFQKTETIHVRGIPLPEVNAGGFWEKVLEGAGEHAGEALGVAIGAALAGLGGWIAKWWRKPRKAAAPAAAP